MSTKNTTTIDQTTHAHGGNLDAIEQMYHIPKAEIMDFSGNINPLGFPDSVKKAIVENLDIVSIYPDQNYTALKNAIAKYTGASPSSIVVGNGSTELISTFIQAINAEKTVILGPAYSEYEREASLTGGVFSYFPLRKRDGFLVNLEELLETLTPDVGLFIACNPNNPTGTVISTEQLRRLLAHCQKNSTAVMIDETYIEFSDSYDQICAIPLVAEFNNLFVIRGISKFFAAPGLRLGYGISQNQAFLNALAKKQDPWSVNILAAFAGERLFSDKTFIEKTKKLISSERKKILDELSTWKSLKAYPSSANFILVRLLTDKLSAHDIFDALIQKKLLIRDAASFQFLDDSFLRFCILLPEQNQLLLQELKALLEY